MQRLFDVGGHLREGVEEALVNGVAEIEGIDVLDDEPTTAFIPLSSIGRKTTGESRLGAGPGDLATSRSARCCASTSTPAARPTASS